MFISYNTHQREDSTLARGLYQCLVRCSPTAVFRDKERLRAADNWREVIDDEIARCSHLVVFITEATEKSDEVSREVKLAEDSQAKIVPVIIGEPRNNPVAQYHAIRLTQSRYIESLAGDVEEICRQVAELTGAALPPKEGRPKAERSGRLVHLLCDRSDLEGQMRGQLAVHRAEKRNQPAALFVCGSEEDRPDSFITRMVDTWIRKWVVDSETAALEPIRIPWIEGVAADSAVRGLKQMILDELGLPDEDQSDEVFIRQMRELTRKGLVIVHTVRCEAWDPEETPAAIARYLRLWEEIGGGDDQPFAILIFKILYSDAARQVQPRAGARSVRQSLVHAIAAWRRPQAKVSAIIADDLQGIGRNDVDEWFKDYAPHVPYQEKKQFLDTLFATGDRQRMSAVEEKLQDFVAT